MEIKRPVNLEEVFENIGGFGRFQFLILTILLYFEIPAAFLAFLPIFIGGSPVEWVCNNETINATFACQCDGSLSIVSTSPATSFVVEWQLMCGSSWVGDFISSLQMLGMFVGTMVGCQISDWYGRRYTFLAMVIFMILGQSASAIATSPYVYGIAKFICGVGLSGYLGISAIYTLEFQSVRWRQLSGSVGPWGEGVMLLALLAYYIRPWRYLVFATTIPLAVVFLVFPFIPESPRWLLRNRRLKECHGVISYIAKINGKQPVDLESLRKIMISESLESGVKRFGYFELFRNKRLRLPTIYQIIIMCCTGITYYGISYNVKNMDGSPYLIVTLMGSGHGDHGDHGDTPVPPQWCLYYTPPYPTPPVPHALTFTTHRPFRHRQFLLKGPMSYHFYTQPGLTHKTNAKEILVATLVNVLCSFPVYFYT